MNKRLSLAQEAVKGIERKGDVFCSRLDDIKDRARRDNLIFHGVPDSRESWAETEKKIVSLMMQHIDPNLTDDIIECAHRLGGSYQENSC